METGKMINKISHRLRRRSQAVQKTVGISEAQGRILDYILVEGARRPVYPKDIEKEFDLRSSTVTGALSALETEGLIARVPDERDGRLKKLVFTPKADGIRAALQGEIEETEKRMLQGISEEEKAVFLELAERMLKNLE
ncbi:MAG TPA: MarR family transcriptional regulator [Candidatus Merdisoma faecalis]|uniref:MarR family winged helix-turn-helix transcriptional regulator n=1 Tax=Lachnoclostridium sp. An138 TaxID=1965560 RepID=UPI000B370333|nr:MarR family transcriptional regulator [Lachnoclostridium sp. An138]OUQ20068.1 MarR family transcriptional regulator [Lachnoclostridium sp. An138]HIR98176.1 MarR family transcriptional regulator [Candidatus Merdisoma faecalis]